MLRRVSLRLLLDLYFCELSSQLGWTRLDFLTTFDDVWQIPNPTGFMSPRSLRIGASRNAWQAQLQLGAWSYSPRMGWGSFSGTLVYLVKTCTNFGFPAGFFLKRIDRTLVHFWCWAVSPGGWCYDWICQKATAKAGFTSRQLHLGRRAGRLGACSWIFATELGCWGPENP